jgi:acyl-CoA dehydrogenase
MDQRFFTEEHEIFRASLQQFVKNEIKPYVDEWEEREEVPRSLFKRMGDCGFLGIDYPERYGGAGADLRYVIVLAEELARCGSGGTASAILVHTTIATPPILELGTESQKQRYLVASIKGESIGALGISEPGAGSDVAGISTTAIRDGNFYTVNGSKTFITNGAIADFIILAAKTEKGTGLNGISLMIVDFNTPGVARGRRLKKMGNHPSMMNEIFFDNVRVPVENVLGEEGRGFYGVMKIFEKERLLASARNVAMAQLALDYAIDYARQRVAFGQTLGKFQAIRHKLADMATQIEAGRQLVYGTARELEMGQDCRAKIAMCKYFTGEMVNRVAYDALQVYGGYGYTSDYPLERISRDARAATIAGGTSEIMKEIISKQMNL